jgi:hypothetical protein
MCEVFPLTGAHGSGGGCWWYGPIASQPCTAALLHEAYLSERLVLFGGGANGDEFVSGCT